MDSFLLPDANGILEIHEIVLQSSGGRSGILHPHALEAALMRPETYFNYDDNCDIYLVCTLIMDSLARNHIFVDGNKRTALMTALFVYNLNYFTEPGKDLTYGISMNEEFEDLVLFVATQKPTIKETKDRLEALLVKYTDNN